MVRLFITYETYKLFYSVTIGGKKFWVFNSKFIPSLIIVPEVIAHPVCAYRIMFIRIDGI